MKKENINEMKIFSSREKSCAKTSRQSNIPTVESITELSIIDYLKKREKAKQLKLPKKEAK